MSPIARIAACLGLVFTVAVNSALAAEVGFPRFPSISPDGSQIVFSYHGDLWTVPFGGGVASRLTSNPFDDLQSAWSKDGTRIAFGSTRLGGVNLFMMSADGTNIRQVSMTDRSFGLTGFGVDEDGKEVLTFSSYLEHDEYRSPRGYMISAQGGDPSRVHEAFGFVPVVSPDGKRVLFTRGGASWLRRGYFGPDTKDVWVYTRADKSFKRLTTWKGNDGRARWINDNEIVFSSDREDNCANLYRMKLDGVEKSATRLTRYADNDVEDFDISANGRTLVFARWDKLYTIDLTKNNAEPVAIEMVATEDDTANFELKDMSRQVRDAALSPDGKTMAFISFGDVYVRGTESKAPTRRVTTKPSRERDIAWAADGAKLYYVSDESGIESIYAASVGKTRSEIKKKITGKSDPATAPATTQPTTDENAEEPEDVRADLRVNGEQPRRMRPGGATTGPTSGPSGGATGGGEVSKWGDALTFTTELISTSPLGDRQPDPSNDGKMLAFSRGPGNLYILDLESKKVRPLFEGWSDGLSWRWSGDSKYIAYVTEDENNNSDIWITKSDGTGKAVNITRHPNNDYSPRWSADGKILAFLSERVNDEYDVWTVWLDREMEALNAQELDQYFKDANAAVKKREPLKSKKAATQPSTTQPSTTQSTTASSTSPSSAESNDISAKPQAATTQAEKKVDVLELDDAYLRLRRVTSLPGSEGALELTPDGSKYIFSASLGTTRGLFLLDRDAPEPRRLGTAVSVQSLNFAGDQIVFVDQSRGGVMKLPGGEQEFYDIADRAKIDLEAYAEQKFLEASRILGAQYWDPKMNGLDWPAVTKKYLQLAKKSRTSDEFDQVANKFLGELNGSHLGINAPDPANPLTRSIGRLGVETARVDGGYKVTVIVPYGPSDRDPMKLKLDDVITAIDFEQFDKSNVADTLDAKLLGKSDREVVVTIQRDGKELDLLITPTSHERIGSLMYNAWRLETARKVDELSNGKIGYIHIEAMSQSSLDLYERDLTAAVEGKKALIIDVRNNGGGSTADLLLGSIMYPKHAYTLPRGMDPNIKDSYPQDRLYIQRCTLPINMLCNEKSFSNAEIISHAFKTLKRGTLVGQQTAGGVISTGGTTLLDGTSVRIPGRAWFLPNGTNMEQNGAIPDLVVPQTPEDEVKSNDAQLKAAVEDLMKRI